MNHLSLDSLRSRALELLANGVGEQAVRRHLGITPAVFASWMADSGFQTTLEVLRAEAKDVDISVGALAEADLAFASGVAAPPPDKEGR